MQGDLESQLDSLPLDPYIGPTGVKKHFVGFVLASPLLSQGGSGKPYAVSLQSQI